MERQSKNKKLQLALGLALGMVSWNAFAEEAIAPNNTQSAMEETKRMETAKVMKIPNAVKQEKPKTIAYLNHDRIVLEEEEKITKFFTPKELLNHGRFQVRIKKPKEIVPEGQERPQPTMADKIEARRLMHVANQAYFKGEVSKAWELVEKAEALDPDFYRIKTMKGSLLYKIGSVDLAKEIWMKSLEQNPNQPEIIKVINQLNAGQSQLSPVARSSQGRKGSVQ